jgi:hypothetical protein
VAVHNEKVFAQARMPETLDRTLDAMTERYGFPLVMADLAYSSPEKALLADTTTGGYVGREDVEATPCHHLAFHDKGVDWEIWLPVSGDPLPRRMRIVNKTAKTPRTGDIIFKQWNLTPQVADAMFTPKVPEDYEGIAMVQRASVLRNIPEAEPTGGRAAPPTPTKPPTRP